MPVWHQIFNELKLAPKLVLCLRNPAQVARSLYARENLDPANGEYRWLAYMIDFYRYASNFDCCALEYEEWFDDPAANIENLRKFLDLPWQQSESDLALLLSDLIDPTARHDDPEHREANQPLVRSLYKLASRAAQDEEARDQIAYIVSQFVGFQQLQRPFQRAFEEVAKVAGKFPEVEQEALALRAAVDERDAVAEAAGARVAAVEGRLAEALAEIEQQQAQIAEIGGELQAAQTDATVRTADLAQTEREAVERAAEVEALQAEVGALWDSLGQLREEAQQREDAEAAVRGEVATLRGSLARAEREAQQRATTAQALEAEARALRGTLARTEGEARERAATTAALQAEIDTLQETLTAARQVGKAAIAAFRIETAAPAKPVVPRGWRQAIMRFLGAETSF
jgi:DNA repair exonuclease SbcCD ATPase subunit